MHCVGEPKVSKRARGKMAHKRNIVDNFKAKSIHSVAALTTEIGLRSVNLWTMLNVNTLFYAAAAAKSLQLCPSVCDPIDGI